MILIAQTLLTGYLALWLLFGLKDNIKYPALNSVLTTQVLQLDRLKEDFPAAYELMKHRRITRPAVQQALFRLIVVCEIIICLLLWSAVIAMVLALSGIVEQQFARTVALAGALGFTSIWSGFLIAGNYFAYWYGHEAAQNTHFQMTLWGIGTMLFLSV